MSSMHVESSPVLQAFRLSPAVAMATIGFSLAMFPIKVFLTAMNPSYIFLTGKFLEDEVGPNTSTNAATYLPNS